MSNNDSRGVILCCVRVCVRVRTPERRAGTAPGYCQLFYSPARQQPGVARDASRQLQGARQQPGASFLHHTDSD
jgi:hypothetical protein